MATPCGCIIWPIANYFTVSYVAPGTLWPALWPVFSRANLVCKSAQIRALVKMTIHTLDKVPYEAREMAHERTYHVLAASVARGPVIRLSLLRPPGRDGGGDHVTLQPLHGREVDEDPLAWPVR